MTRTTRIYQLAELWHVLQSPPPCRVSCVDSILNLTFRGSLPTRWGCVWVYHSLGMLLSPGPGQLLGSYVVKRVLAIRLVQ